jgi:DMSO/TMAO reductase YedYZ molybdopterin-dependent catalytic subunit
MKRKVFVSSTTAAMLGTIVSGASAQPAGRSALSVRPTIGGPLITPNESFFVYSQMRTPAQQAVSVQIDGLVDTATRYDESDLRNLPHVKHLWTFECFVNTAGGPLIFTTGFEGVPLSALFQKVRLKPQARSALVETNDGHPPFLLPLSELQRPDAMLVAAMGGNPASLEHGGAYTKLLIPGAGGNHGPKWVSRITLVSDDAPEHPAPPMAGFLFPSPPEAIGSLSGVTLTGYAFAGPERVGAVELSTDDGATYQRMPLPAQADPYLWMTWEVTWRPPQRGFYVLRVRARSTSGRKQDVPHVIAVEVR